MIALPIPSVLTYFCWFLFGTKKGPLREAYLLGQKFSFVSLTMIGIVMLFSYLLLANSLYQGEDLSFMNNFAYGFATYVTLNFALVNLFQA